MLALFVESLSPERAFIVATDGLAEFRNLNYIFF